MGLYLGMVYLGWLYCSLLLWFSLLLKTQELIDKLQSGGLLPSDEQNPSNNQSTSDSNSIPQADSDAGQPAS